MITLKQRAWLKINKHKGQCGGMQNCKEFASKMLNYAFKLLFLHSNNCFPFYQYSFKKLTFTSDIGKCFVWKQHQETTLTLLNRLRMNLLGNISLVYYTTINRDKQSLHTPSCWETVKQFSGSNEVVGVQIVSSTNLNAQWSG